MPELAEVAYASTRWKAGINLRIQEVTVHPKSRVFREHDRSSFIEELSGSILRSSQTHGKQMLFGFSGNRWLGLHLGMTGWLHSEPTSYSPAKHDAIVFTQSKQKLVFRDPRQFGRLRLHIGKELPAWWSEQPTSMLNPSFDKKILKDALARHKKRPIKALLLDQRYFPGMGNWMADEVLWRACIHPACRSGEIKKPLCNILFKQILFVARGAMKSVGKHGGDPPKGWLFHHRWKDGGICPKSKNPLIREEIGGRTSCWSPARQSLEVAK